MRAAHSQTSLAHPTRSHAPHTIISLSHTLTSFRRVHQGCDSTWVLALLSRDVFVLNMVVLVNVFWEPGLQCRLSLILGFTHTHRHARARTYTYMHTYTQPRVLLECRPSRHQTLQQLSPPQRLMLSPPGDSRSPATGFAPALAGLTVAGALYHARRHGMPTQPWVSRYNTG